MSGTALGAIVAIVVGYAGGLTATLLYLGSRIDHLTNEVSDLKAIVTGKGQRLEDHIENHPGPTDRLVRP